MKINKKIEKVSGICLAALFVSLILLAIGYTFFTQGFFSLGSQNRYFDYQDR